jgi:hypothetical protein
VYFIFFQNLYYAELEDSKFSPVSLTLMQY